MTKRTFGMMALIIGALVSQTASAQQPYPNRPITMIVAYAAGGPTDAFARIVTEGMREQLGQPIVIDNRTGAGGGIGAQIAADAKPDGYTIHLMGVGLIALPIISKAYAYFDPVKAYTPISYLTHSPLLALVPAALPVKDIREFIAYAKNNPGKLNFGSQGASLELDVGLFIHLAGVQMQSIPYKGGAPMVAALVANEIQFGADSPSVSGPHVNSGALRALAVLSSKPWPLRPDLPMMKDIMPEYSAMAGFFGVNGPRGLSKEVVDRVGAASRMAVNRPDIKKRLEALSVVVADAGPEELERQTRMVLETGKRAAAAINYQPQ